jgi:hypothetical protein
MRDKVNKDMIPLLVNDWKNYFAFTTSHVILSFYASYNEWYPFAEKVFSKQVSCAGIDFL